MKVHPAAIAADQSLRPGTGGASARRRLVGRTVEPPMYLVEGLIKLAMIPSSMGGHALMPGVADQLRKSLYYQSGSLASQATRSGKRGKKTEKPSGKCSPLQWKGGPQCRSVPGVELVGGRLPLACVVGGLRQPALRPPPVPPSTQICQRDSVLFPATYAPLPD